MGQRITRPLRNFNVENRAAKALERQQKAPKAAPKHVSSADTMAQMQQENPGIIDEIENKNVKLHENLKGLYVDTKDPPIQIRSAQPLSQHLSRRGNTPGDLDLGVMDVVDGVEVPVGRSTLRDVMAFVAAYQENPADQSVSSIAEKHRLDEATVSNILMHFKVMHLHIPREMHKDAKSRDKVMNQQLKASEQVAASFKLEQPAGETNSRQSIPGDVDTSTPKT